ncbi:MAG: hypothetical protein V3S45_05610 [Kiloniellales bacterium]
MLDNSTPLSRIILQNPEVTSFNGLLEVLQKHGQAGGVLLYIDLKPEFPDTPRNWEFLLEAAFTGGPR